MSEDGSSFVTLSHGRASLTRWLGEGPVLSYRGDGPVLTGGALVCVCCYFFSLVVYVRGTFYVDRRHGRASVTPLFQVSRLPPSSDAYEQTALCLSVPNVSFIMSTRSEWCSSARK
jgi:hypothetical protein